MSARSLLSLAIALVAAACALPGNPPGHGGGPVVYPQPGKGGKFACPHGPICELKIDVVACKAVEEMVHVNADTIVRWRVPPTWKFADPNGIIFKPGTPSPAGAFEVSSPGGGPLFQWHVRKNPTPSEKGYGYGVHVEGPDGKRCDFDPALWV